MSYDELKESINALTEAVKDLTESVDKLKYHINEADDSTRINTEQLRHLNITIQKFREAIQYKL